MKKFFAFAISLALFGCDDTRSQNPTAPPTDTISQKIDTVRTTITSRRTIIIGQKGINYDTVTVHNDTNIVIGTIVNKDDGKGANTVVCSEAMNRCSRTNSKGVYAINPAPFRLVAGRIAETVDTVITPETVVAAITSDTTKDTVRNLDTVAIVDTTHNIDTLANETQIVVVDSVEIIDTVYNTDTTNIVVTINKPDTVKIKDTLTIVENGSILREIPIDSWGFILPPNYIVQRDISANDMTWDSCLTKVEAVYFITGDSLAKVIPLGRSGHYFSGFLYTYYNDSSFKYDKKIYNLFLRGLDSTGKVIVKTEIESFSERLGDVGTKNLSVKVGVPQWKITPRIVPAAKNNKKLKIAVEEYVVDSTVNWLGETEIKYPRVTNLDNFSVIAWKLNPQINDFDSVSIEVYTDTTIMNVPTNNGNIQISIQRNTWVKISENISSFSRGMIAFGPPDTVFTRYRNIRFYPKM